MDTRQKSKLERYLKNSSRFLWGLGRGNQDESYKWLKRKGFTFKEGSYSSVTAQLLENPGLEKLLDDVITPEVRALFPQKTLDFLRDCWEAGTRPDITLLKQHNVKNWAPFLEINTQFDYVERWGEFAGPWFEEIEIRRD